MENGGGLTAAQRSKIRRLSQPRELAPDEEGGELNIVPFLDIIVNILIFVLATISVVFTTKLDAAPPSNRTAGTRGAEKPALNLTVMLVNDGIAIKGAKGNVAPGCRGVGPGVALPLHGGQYDFRALKTCAAQLRAAVPDFASEQQFYLTANPGVEFQAIVGVIDAMATDPEGKPMFTDPIFTVTR